MTAEEAGRLASDALADRLVLTHVWQEHDFVAVRTRAATEFSGEILIARPGLSLEW